MLISAFSLLRRAPKGATLSRPLSSLPFSSLNRQVHVFSNNLGLLHPVRTALSAQGGSYSLFQHTHLAPSRVPLFLAVATFKSGMIICSNVTSTPPLPPQAPTPPALQPTAAKFQAVPPRELPLEIYASPLTYKRSLLRAALASCMMVASAGLYLTVFESGQPLLAAVCVLYMVTLATGVLWIQKRLLLSIRLLPNRKVELVLFNNTVVSVPQDYVLPYCGSKRYALFVSLSCCLQFSLSLLALIIFRPPLSPSFFFLRSFSIKPAVAYLQVHQGKKRMANLAAPISPSSIRMGWGFLTTSSTALLS